MAPKLHNVRDFPGMRRWHGERIRCYKRGGPSMELTYWQVFKVTFLTILVAELGDKTQLLTIKLAV